MNKKFSLPVSQEMIPENIVQLMKFSSRFKNEDVERLERLTPLLGRCHEMVNKIEQFFSMRSDIGDMASVTSKLLSYVDASKSSFGTLQQHFRKFQDDTSTKHQTMIEVNRLLNEATLGPP